uniref:Integrase catalytic domain-containing protein n=1 Tax=Tanacetum cinerariifolium TaxID=118510 RepID=A0A6L2LSV8_TANCI|nr:hypothetical protein [Tanacetum cinerariifolium]
MSYLSEYEEINSGYVSFGRDPKGGKIVGNGKINTGKLDFKDVYFVKELKFNLFRVSQNSVLFTDTKCVVLSPDFKLLDQSQVLLRVPRKNNMYSVDLNNFALSGGLTCLFAKATLDEYNLWHKRLGHINFKTINKLVRGNLVRGLASKNFENDHTCVACHKGKQNKASCKTKTVSSIRQPLQMLHMDLFGLTFIKSLMKKIYCLVVIDDYSRFSWVFFLATKDETSRILKAFITGIENLIDHKVKTIRCDNGTKFKNKEMNQFCEKQGIKREFSFARTLQQNRVAERKIRTLIEATRSMLANSKLPTTFWAEAVNTNTKFKLYETIWCLVTILNTLDPLESGPIWIFDIDTLTKSINYKPVVAGNQSNGSAEEPKVNQEKDSVNSTNRVNTVSLIVNAASNEVNGIGRKSSIELPDDPNMPNLKDISIFEDSNEDVFGAVADLNNMETTSQASPIPTIRIHKDHPVEQIIGDIRLTPQTRRMTKNVTDHAIQEELLQFKLQQVWTLMDLPYGKRAIETKWIYKNKKDDRGIMVRNKARLVAQGYTQEEGIDYDEVFAPVARIKAIRVSRSRVVNRVYKVEKALYGLHQAPKAWYETLSTYLLDNGFQRGARFQVTPKVSRLHAVKRIFRYLKGQPKLCLWYPKDSPFDLEAYTDSDYAGANLDRKSTTRGCQFLGSRLISWQYKKQTIVANSTTEAEYVVAANCYGQGRLIVFNCSGLYTNDDWNEVKHLLRMDLRLTLIIDFLNVNHIKYALTVNPTIYTSCIEQFWVTAKAKNINREAQIHANMDGKKVIISKATMRRDLKFEDEGGIDGLSSEVIFEQLPLMGYENLSQKLTFNKTLFSPQWKFLIHSILQCLSDKTTAWNEFSSTMASAIICLATNQKFNFSKYLFDSMVKHLDSRTKFLMYPRFVQVFLDKQVDRMSKHNVIYVIPSRTKKVFSNMRRVGKDFSVRETPLFPIMLVPAQEEELSEETTKTSQAKEISSLKRRVKRLEKKNKSRTHGLKRLYKIGLSARVESSAEEQSLDEGRYDDQEMFYIDVLNNEEVVVETAAIDATTTTVSIGDITLAQEFMEIKTSKPKARGIIMQEASETPTTTTKIPISSKVQDKEKVVKDKVVLTQESSSKRAGDKLNQGRSKKQKVKDDKEQEELKRCLESIPGDGVDSRMELYIDNRENGRMIFNSMLNGPLVWPTVNEENGTTRTKKYEELSVAKKLQADYDLKATNIVLQGLPLDMYAIVNHHKVSKDI